MPNLSKLNMSSQFASLKNYANVDFSLAVGGFTIPAGGYSRRTVTYPLNNTNAISSIKIRYNGLQSWWRPLPGYVITNFPVYNAPDYQIQTFSYYKGGLLYIDTYISNQTGGTVSIPGFTIEVSADLYIAPFN
jgi:hypothetical protein